MEKNATGSVWRIDLASGKAACLADGLAFPYGVHRGRRWQRPDRLRELASPAAAAAGRRRARRCRSCRKLPGYPARLAPAPDGGAWLALFAPRNRLIEFVLQEDDYRAT